MNSTKFYNSTIIIVLALLVAPCGKAESLRTFYLDNPSSAIVNAEALTREQQTFLSHYLHLENNIQNDADLANYFLIEEATTEEDSVPSLLGEITYNQTVPYNNKCPYLNGGRAVTGCVATAMAQVMRYYAYPDKGTGIVKYTGGNGEITIDLADYTFDWNKILTHYERVKYTDEEADAVASLMLACGASLNMIYSKDGSGTATAKVQSAMRDNFGYSKDIAFQDFSGVSDFMDIMTEDYAPLIREEFRKGHPVIFGGKPSRSEAGHCFILDGYKVIDGVYYYHVNWGWEGYLNGYYLLTNLKPENESYSGYGCVIVYNIYPPDWTAIDEVEIKEQPTDNTIYNILGQVVSPENRQTGHIYIQSGKKYIYY